MSATSSDAALGARVEVNHFADVSKVVLRRVAGGPARMCCGLPMAYVEPAGIAEIRARHRDLEGTLLGSIVHDLGISGGLAHRLLESLHRDHGPTVHLFRCLACACMRAPIDLP